MSIDLTSPAPSDADMLNKVRHAKNKLVSDIALGKAAKRISMPEMQIEEQDVDKVLGILESMEAHYLSRTGENRNSFVMR